MVKIFLLLLFAFPSDVKAQSGLERLFSDNRGINQTVHIKAFDNNQGFVVVTSNRSGGDIGKLHIRKFSASGTEQWNYIYSITEFQSISTVNVTASNGILISGHGRDSKGSSIAVLVSVDEAGKLLWARFYAPTGGTGGIYSATETSNKEILIYGFHYPLGGGDSRKYLVRLNKDGEVIEGKTLFSSYRWGVATPSKDGGLYISELTGAHKFDEKGNLIWFVRWPSGFQGMQFLAVAEDNSLYAIIRGTFSVLVKISPQGNILWQKRFVGNYSNLAMMGNKPVIFVSGSITVLEEDGSIRGTIKPNNHYLELTHDNAGRTWLASIATIGSKQGVLLAQTGDILNLSCAGKGEPLELTPENLSFVRDSYSPVPLNMESTPVSGITMTIFSQTDTLCHKKPEIPGLGADTIICKGDSLELDAGPSGFEYIWSNGAKSRKIWVKNSGTYWVKVIYSFGEQDFDTINIQNFPKPQLNWVINNSDLEPGDTLSIQDNSPVALQRTWFVNDKPFHGNNPFEYVIPGNGNYSVSLRITDSIGCTSEISYRFNVAVYWIYIPTAFSPNNDGLNEFFGPEAYGIIYNQIIFNRWGEIVFEGENTAWDGRFKGKEAPVGIYFHKTRIKTVDGKLLHRSGSLYLLR